MAGDRFAIIIGCNNYPKDPEQFSTLRSAENDAKGVRDILVDKCNFNNENIKLFTSEAHWEILREINMRLKQVQSNDFVLIYFSGHGKLDEENIVHLAVSNTEVRALDATSLPVSSIKYYIDKSSTNRVVLILDCCYSGALGRLFSKGSVDDALRVAAKEGKGKYMLTASTGIQVAHEKEGEEYSNFTKYFIEGLKTGNADLDNDGKITVDELYTYVHAKVKEDNFQEPMKFAFGVQGDIVLVDKVRKHLMPESLSVKMLLSEKSRELVGYTALRHELVYIQRIPATLEAGVTRFLEEEDLRRKGEHIKMAINDVDRLTMGFDKISYILKEHSFLKEDSKITRLTEIIGDYIRKIKGILETQRIIDHPILTHNDLYLVKDIDRAALNAVSYLDHKVEDIGVELVKISGSEEIKNAQPKLEAKDKLGSRLEQFVLYWEDGECILEGNEKREKELRKRLSNIGNELKEEVKENKKLLSPVIGDKVNEFGDDIINLSTKIAHRVIVVNENEDRRRRIKQKVVEEGDKLEEKAKELIEELQQEGEEEE
ncbi:MAG: caspase family protein [Methanophagales archaeon]|nr:caspase family protein [Methanophagales archaeon]